jgi:hypothetical protein
VTDQPPPPPPPPPPPEGQQYPQQPPARKRGGCGRAALIGLAVFGGIVVIAVIAAIAGGDDDDQTTTEETTTTTVAEETTTEGAPTTTEAPATTAPPLPGFGDGTQLVGTDVQPGRYVSEGDLCYFERLSGLSGTFEEIITNGNVSGQAIVEILPTDVAFNSSSCGDWTLYQPPAAPAEQFDAGDWVVNEQIVPGTYQAQPAGPCYWERAGGFAHDFGEIHANANPTGQAVVEILPSDVRFTSNGCGTWSRVG